MTQNEGALQEAERECARTTGDLLQVFKEGVQYTHGAGLMSPILKLDSQSPRHHEMVREYVQTYSEGIEWVISTRVVVETSIRSRNKVGE